MRKVSKPAPNISSLVLHFFSLLDEGEMSGTLLERNVGVADSTISSWRLGRRSPKLLNFEACLNALGYELIIKKR